MMSPWLALADALGWAVLAAGLPVLDGVALVVSVLTLVVGVALASEPAPDWSEVVEQAVRVPTVMTAAAAIRAARWVTGVMARSPRGWEKYVTTNNCAMAQLLLHHRNVTTTQLIVVRMERSLA